MGNITSSSSKPNRLALHHQASWRLMQIMDGEICCGERKRYLNLLDLWDMEWNGMRCAHMRIRHATCFPAGWQAVVRWLLLVFEGNWCDWSMDEYKDSCSNTSLAIVF